MEVLNLNEQQVLITRQKVLDLCSKFKYEYVGDINELKNSKCKITYKCLCGTIKCTSVRTFENGKCNICNDPVNETRKKVLELCKQKNYKFSEYY